MGFETAAAAIAIACKCNETPPSPYPYSSLIKSFRILFSSAPWVSSNEAEMKGSILEVLLVSAAGLTHSAFFGNRGFYVVIQCGKEVHSSRITSAAGKGQRTRWNEKIIFQIPLSELRDSCHLTLRIMDKHIFSEDDVFGETMIHLEGIISEGSKRGWKEIKPAAYNIVAEDGTYQGAIKIGLNFIHNVEIEGELTKQAVEEALAEESQTLLGTILNFMRTPWFKLCFLQNHRIPKAHHKNM